MAVNILKSQQHFNNKCPPYPRKKSNAPAPHPSPAAPPPRQRPPPRSRHAQTPPSRTPPPPVWRRPQRFCAHPVRLAVESAELLDGFQPDGDVLSGRDVQRALSVVRAQHRPEGRAHQVDAVANRAGNPCAQRFA